MLRTLNIGDSQSSCPPVMGSWFSIAFMGHVKSSALDTLIMTVTAENDVSPMKSCVRISFRIAWHAECIYGVSMCSAPSPPNEAAREKVGMLSTHVLL